MDLIVGAILRAALLGAFVVLVAGTAGGNATARYEIPLGGVADIPGYAGDGGGERLPKTLWPTGSVE